MDHTEYWQRLEVLLHDIPDSVAGFIRQQAYDRGHSAGYKEVLNIAEDLKFELKYVIEHIDILTKATEKKSEPTRDPFLG